MEIAEDMDFGAIDELWASSDADTIKTTNFMKGKRDRTMTAEQEEPE